jgi:hypothetical protein
MSAQTHTPAPPTVEEVRRIVAISSPVVRNLEITYCYGRLSAAMGQRTGPGANWCTFATWASRQAGRTIRGEDLIETLRARLDQGPRFLHPIASLGRVLLRRGLLDPQTRLGRLTAQLHTPFDVFERTSDAVARGNRKVFEEIGLEFARYLQEVAPDAGADSPQLRAFLSGLRPGEPPDGQRYLHQAFTRYARVAATTDEAARAQLLLLANLEIGMHEQTRLQPEIRESLDAAYDVEQDLDRRLRVSPARGTAESAVHARTGPSIHSGNDPRRRAVALCPHLVRGRGSSAAALIVRGGDDDDALQYLSSGRLHCLLKSRAASGTTRHHT